MRRLTDRGMRGFTLVELMVVLAIVALLAAVAIPGLARLGAFSRDEYRRTLQEVSGLLRAAQIYATSYHVNTAVVYSMDNWSEIEAVTNTDVPVTQPVIDSVTGNPVRQFQAAAIMYELPSTTRELSGHYVPVPTPDGTFRTVPNDMAILLVNPEQPSIFDPAAPATLYFELDWSNFRNGATVNRWRELGLAQITAALNIPLGMDPISFNILASNPANFATQTFPAHVFKPSGRMAVAAPGERFTMYIGPSADRRPGDRLIFPDAETLMNLDGSTNMMYRKIHIFKSTGRTEIPKNF